MTLINNVSSHAITTLNPDEMLAKIAEEIENGLPYDHIGIAILDYSAKELVIQAEAGARRDALGRRIPAGRRLGRPGGAHRPDGHRSRGRTPRTPRTGPAGFASPRLRLPVIYGEQLLGVLYVESSEPCDFPEQEVLLLRTLADLFAGALHNALTFQKAQEQAITDGLTGVKTHRFLMEALSSEWKRSTRANRPFALVLMDLDRFKFVNDFYGHLEGDVVLQRVGHILEQNCRRSDVVARYGGDEFVILMPETTVEQARQLASKLRGWVASDPLLRDKNITASFGIAGFPVHGSTPQELIQVADSSMYLSKHQGGNSVSSAEQGDPNDRKTMEERCARGLSRRHAEAAVLHRAPRRSRKFIAASNSSRARSPSRVRRLRRRLPPAVVETVTSLALAIDAKDHYTQGHSQKVSAYAVMIAQALGMTQAQVEEIRLAGAAARHRQSGNPRDHPEQIRPARCRRVGNDENPHGPGRENSRAARSHEAAFGMMVRHHHEFYDGTGYPDRLEGEQIPYGARVIAIADAYDTITSERTYKKAAHARRRIRRTRTLRRQPIRSRDRPRLHRNDAPRPPANGGSKPRHLRTPQRYGPRIASRRSFKWHQPQPAPTVEHAAPQLARHARLD